jgi:L-fucose isomerase-like protein
MKTTLGVIVGNRDFFPDVLVSEARRDLTKLFAESRPGQTRENAAIC